MAVFLCPLISSGIMLIMRRCVSVLILCLILASCGQPTFAAYNAPTSTIGWELLQRAPNTATPTATPTVTLIPTATPTATNTPMPTNTPEPTPTPIPLTATQVPVADKVLYLSFDDGPDPNWTPQILEVLARHNAKATFFVIGRSAYSFPDTLQAIRDGGHTLGNHTWDHASLKGMSQHQFNDEVQTTQSILGIGGTNCLRPPYGATDGNTTSFAELNGLRLMLWGVDSLDWRQPGTEAITNRVVSLARPDTVVLFHDGGGNREQTVAALDAILSQLSAQGYSFAAPCQ